MCAYSDLSARAIGFNWDASSETENQGWDEAPGRGGPGGDGGEGGTGAEGMGMEKKGMKVKVRGKWCKRGEVQDSEKKITKYSHMFGFKGKSKTRTPPLTFNEKSLNILH